MHSAEKFHAVQALIAAGYTDHQIEVEANVPRGTVRSWRAHPKVSNRVSTEHPCGINHDFSALPAGPYCYLLGLYLGDGCISAMNRVWRLRIVLDTQYPVIIESCRSTIDLLLPLQRAAILARPSRCVEVSSYSKHWPCLLPQHGLGRKHHRTIALASWQAALVAKSPKDLVRGLIHSDGCRVVANDRGVRSIRYHFTNYSDDILGIFAGALDLLDIPWTRPSEHVIAVYRKAATARLDEFIGPKA